MTTIFLFGASCFMVAPAFFAPDYPWYMPYAGKRMNLSFCCLCFPHRKGLLVVNHSFRSGCWRHHSSPICFLYIFPICQLYSSDPSCLCKTIERASCSIRKEPSTHSDLAYKHDEVFNNSPPNGGTTCGSYS